MKIIRNLLALFRGQHLELPSRIVHNFPNIGMDGEVTMHCIIHASARPGPHYSPVNENPYAGVIGIPSHCVGAVFVESDEYGLRLHWKPFNVSENSVLSPFKRPTS